MAEWRGWNIEGEWLLRPLKLRLNPRERQIMLMLILAKGKRIQPEIMMKTLSFPSLSSMRTIISRLRIAIGKDSISMERHLGYKLLRADGQADPLSELIRNLSSALESAKRLKRSILIEERLRVNAPD